ncbi:unnamed protein product [Polarella glacialis]|uniref:K Homology domain-containing protein n=1 Tax=Polarella glacialis TaxID=89957 RepID=A0A813F7R2_POLGL|nr:unnamed protein product [Polarella glacialis]CAE8693027.1 unnamed protein product [Polarella glacialis]
MADNGAAPDCFYVPWRCLVPSDVAFLIVGGDGDGDEDADGGGDGKVEGRDEDNSVAADGSAWGVGAEEIPAKTGASVRLLPTADAPTLSDRILEIRGESFASQETACCKVLRSLRDALGVEEDSEEALFVVLVPSAVAAVVVGAKGQKIQALSQASGAKIDVSREVIPGLCVQPVTVSGTLDQVISGVAGVHRLLQELVDRGRLSPTEFGGSQTSMERAVSGDGTATPRSTAGTGTFTGTGCSGSSRGGLSVSPSPVLLLISMDAAGWIIGKQGLRLAELQRSSGARIRLANNGAGLPGMRCGDRLVEIAATDVDCRAAAVRAVMATLGEAPMELDMGSISLLLPTSAVGYVIGKGGQTIKKIMVRTGVDILIDQDSSVAGARTASFPGTAVGSCTEPILELVSEVDELRERVAAGVASTSAPNSRASASPSPGMSLSGVARDVHAGSSGGAAAFCSEPLPGRGQAEMPDRAGAGYGDQREGLGYRSSPPGGSQSPAGWPIRTQAERALLDGIQASGVLDHKLTIQVPQSMLIRIDFQDIERRSGARLEVSQRRVGEDLSVSVAGQRIATALAALYLQEAMALCDKAARSGYP